MRTTLTIDDHVARALKERAHRSGKSFKQIVNETLRAGLGASGARRRRPYRVKPAALGGVMPGINLDKALALADAIEDQELMAKMQLRK
jgi:plasmid stability protein